MTILRELLGTSLHSALIELRPDGTIQDVNEAFARKVRAGREELVGQPLASFLTAGDQDRLRAWTTGEALPDGPIWMNFAAGDGTPFTLRCRVGRAGEDLLILGEPEVDQDGPAAEELMRLNNELATMARERARRERELEGLRADLEATLEELRTSYWHLQKIQEVIPICMECGMIKPGAARWQSIVDYLKENEIFVSHGYCPECSRAKEIEWGLS